MPPDPKERRKYARLDLALTVAYRVIGQTGQQPANPADAISQDVSLGGLRLMTPTALPNGTEVELDIHLADEQQPIKATGEIMWQTKLSGTSYETGVLIKGMPAEDRGRFMSFVFDQMSKMVINAQ